MKKSEIRQIISDIDKDENGTVEFDEFCDLMAGRISNRDTREEIMKIFRLFADEGSDFITFRNLKRVVMDLEENLNDDDMMEMIEEADRNGDGKLSQKEVLRAVRKSELNELVEATGDLLKPLLRPSTWKALWKLMDVDGDGYADFAVPLFAENKVALYSFGK